MKEAGYFRHFGVSNFNDKQIEQIEQFLPVEVFQPQYSLLVRQQKPLIDFAAKKDIDTPIEPDDQSISSHEKRYKTAKNNKPPPNATRSGT